MPAIAPTETLPGTLYAQAAQYAANLANHEDLAVSQVNAAWRSVQASANADLDAVVDKYARAVARGDRISPAWAFQEARLEEALTTARREIKGFGRDAATITAHAQAESAAMAQAAARGLILPAVSPVLGATFSAVNPDNLKRLVGFLGDGSPLASLFDAIGIDALAQARQVLSSGVLLGRSPARITRDLHQAMDLPRHRAETIARTEVQRVYRATSRETYRANADVLEGWVWTAKLSPSCCSACILMSGTLHDVDETLDGHPRCRCTMVPRTKSWADLLGDPSLPDTRPPIVDGKAWFLRQSAADRRAILGPRKFAALKARKITVDDLVARPSNDQWGTMRRERSMAEIRQGRNANVPTKSVQPNSPAPVKVAPQAPVKPAVETRQVRQYQARVDASERNLLSTQNRLNGVGLDDPRRAIYQRMVTEAQDDLKRAQGSLAKLVQTEAARPVRPVTGVTSANHAASGNLLDSMTKNVKAMTDYQDHLNARIASLQQKQTDLVKSMLDNGAPSLKEAKAAAAASYAGQDLKYSLAAARKALKAQTKDLVTQTAARDNLARRMGTQTPTFGWVDDLPLKPVVVNDLDDLRAVNPHWATGTDYQVNCPRTSASWEMRERGFDVTAAPAVNKAGEPVSVIQGMWRQADGTERLWSERLLGGTNALNVAESWPMGSRGFVTVHWKDGGAHIWNVEHTPNGARFIDTQPNAHVATDPTNQYLKDGKANTWQIIRVDDLHPVDDLANWVKRAGDTTPAVHAPTKSSIF